MVLAHLILQIIFEMLKKKSSIKNLVKTKIPLPCSIYNLYCFTSWGVMTLVPSQPQTYKNTSNANKIPKVNPINISRKKTSHSFFSFFLRNFGNSQAVNDTNRSIIMISLSIVNSFSHSELDLFIGIFRGESYLTELSFCRFCKTSSCYYYLRLNCNL